MKSTKSLDLRLYPTFCYKFLFVSSQSIMYSIQNFKGDPDPPADDQSPFASKFITNVAPLCQHISINYCQFMIENDTTFVSELIKEQFPHNVCHILGKCKSFSQQTST